MEQKVIQIGNSSGVILPKEIMKKMGLKPGSKVVIQTDSSGKTLLVSKNGKKYSPSVTPEFTRLLTKVNEQYDDALKELAQK